MDVIKTLGFWFHPTLDAFLTRNIPLHLRLRLLVFQPLAILIYLLNAVPCALLPRDAAPKTIWIPVREGRKLRALVYFPRSSVLKDDTTESLSCHLTSSPSSPRAALLPLHLDIHGGAFIGGHPEADFRFCRAICSELRTIVVSPSYRFAPRYAFPAALDDIDDVIDWLAENGESVLGVDMECFTVGGSSAGGNLALAAAARLRSRRRNIETCRKVEIKGVVTFYAPVDLSIPPMQKPKPQNFPKRDPMAFLLPLYDAYALSGREKGFAKDVRLSPCNADIDDLPSQTLMIVPMIDILPHEQLQFAERVRAECEMKGITEMVQLMIMEKCFHGWLELPSSVIDESTRSKVFDRCVEFLSGIQHGVGGGID